MKQHNDIKINSVFFLSLIGLIIFGCNEQAISLEDDLENHKRVMVSITTPHDNSSVGMEEVIRGKLTDPLLHVYVLIHPLKTDLWYFQNLPSIDITNNTFRCYCYFGNTTEGIGQPFEIIAIATKRNKRYPAGKTIRQLPSKAYRSPIVQVKRDH